MIVFDTMKYNMKQLNKLHNNEHELMYVNNIKKKQPSSAKIVFVFKLSDDC